MTLWHMGIACWIPKSTNTHIYYVTFIDFSLQKWVHERSPIVRFMYIAVFISLYKTPLIITFSLAIDLPYSVWVHTEYMNISCVLCD